MSGSPLKPGSIGGLKMREPGVTRDNPTMIIYGGAGAGKTGLAASACLVPEMCPVLHINLEDGAQTVERMYPEQLANGDIVILDVETFAELQNVFTELHNTKGAGFNTCIVDNATEAQAMGVDYIMNVQGAVDFSDFNAPTYANGGYARSAEQMRKMIRYFRGLPITTIFTAWARNYSSGNIPEWAPAFFPTFAAEAPGLVNDLYYYSIDKDGRRILQTTKTDRIEAKDRTGTLPSRILDPSMQKLNDYWTGKTIKPVTTTEETSSTSTLKKASKK